MSAVRAGTAYFSWEVPEANLVVHFHLNVVQLLERDAFRAGDRSAAGLLLGRHEHGPQRAIIIEDYESATPERGAVESPLKHRALVEAIANRWRRGQKTMSVQGFYRTCGQEGDTLDAHDLEVLGVEPARPESASNAANNAVPKAEGASCISACDESERVFLLMEPYSGRGGMASLYLAKGNNLVCQSSRMSFTRTEMARRGTLRQMSQPELPDDPLPFRQDQNISHERGADEQVGKASRLKLTRRWLSVCAAAAALLSLGLLKVRSQPSSGLLWAGGATPGEVGLGLHTERKGLDWEIKWNHDAAILRDAENAHLRIDDGYLHKNIEIGPSELRSGTVVYTPLSDDVAVRLELKTAQAKEPISESVRIVAGAWPLASPDQVLSGRVSAALRGPLAQSVRSSRRQKTDLDKDKVLGPAASPLMAKRALSEGPARSDTDVELNSASDQDSKQPLGGAASEATSLALLPNTRAGDQLKLAELASAVEPPAAVGEPEMAQLLVRKDPAYPEAAARQKISGAVELRFKIDKNGEVHDIKVVKGSSILARAALEAIRQWRYKPARLNGVATDSEGRAIVEFNQN